MSKSAKHIGTKTIWTGNKTSATKCTGDKTYQRQNVPRTKRMSDKMYRGQKVSATKNISATNLSADWTYLSEKCDNAKISIWQQILNVDRKICNKLRKHKMSDMQKYSTAYVLQICSSNLLREMIPHRSFWWYRSSRISSPCSWRTTWRYCSS